MTTPDVPRDAAPVRHRGKTHVWAPDNRPPAPFDRLTPMQLAVAKAIAVGERHVSIAGRLRISPKTVDTHRGHVLNRLEIAGNVQLARLAIRAGLVSVDESDDAIGNKNPQAKADPSRPGDS